MAAKYVLALDQGTTSSRAILFDREGKARASASQEFPQYYPQPGWVEHDAEEIWQSQLAVAEQVLARAHAQPEEIAALGITNQRETVVLWDRKTSKPLHRAIVWQCRRTAPMCDRIRSEGFDRIIREKTGLVTDAYFSGTKIAWLLENLPGARERAERGELAGGTIDTWLLWRLTRGRVLRTDCSNASRTLLFNLRTLTWDREILDYFRIPSGLLPEVRSSSEVLAETDLFGARLPIAGVAGDQQASLFGHQCFLRGGVKNTYGTGCFLLMNTGSEIPRSESGLVATIAWGLPALRQAQGGDPSTSLGVPERSRRERSRTAQAGRSGQTVYALEGSVFIAGAALQWLRDELKVIGNVEESSALARTVEDTGGVYFVPAFVGLGAPHWDSTARGTLVGLTRGTNRNHLVRATLESIAYQTREVVEAMAKDSAMRPLALRVDGGAAKNDFLCQFQADLLGIPVERAATAETTALGAAYLAGLATGFWKSEEELARQPRIGRRFVPAMAEDRRQELYAGWRRAVERAKGWAL